MRYGVIQFPILGEASVWFAIASECAAEQDSFWEYHDRLYEETMKEESDIYSREGLVALGVELGLDNDRFNSCMAEARPLEQLRADYRVATALGVGSTPTIFINDVQYRGDRTFEAMRTHIERQLAD